MSIKFIILAGFDGKRIALGPRDMAPKPMPADAKSAGITSASYSNVSGLAAGYYMMQKTLHDVANNKAEERGLNALMPKLNEIFAPVKNSFYSISAEDLKGRGIIVVSTFGVVGQGHTYKQSFLTMHMGRNPDQAYDAYLQQPKISDRNAVTRVYWALNA